MVSPDAVAALAACFIVVMVWLRTRLHHAGGRARERPLEPQHGPTRTAAGLRAVTPAGWGYFVALLLLLALGWFAAPALAPHLAPGTPVAPLLARVVWFLAVYYLLIPVHRVLRSRGVELFKTPVGGIQS